MFCYNIILWRHRVSFTRLSIETYKDLKANYHAHTTRCNHANGSEREYVESAIENGFKLLGFSDHAPHMFDDGYVSPIRMKPEQMDDYARIVTDLKSEYKDDIKILLGLEMEYYPPRVGDDMTFLEQFPLDYMILGQHYYYDEPYTPYVGNPTDDPALLKGYVNVVLEAISSNLFTYVAHPDIMHFVGDKSVYQSEMGRLCDAMKAAGMPYEINMGGYRDGINYPDSTAVDVAAAKDMDFIIGVDAHSPRHFADINTYEACKKMALERGKRLINL